MRVAAAQHRAAGGGGGRGAAAAPAPPTAAARDGHPVSLSRARLLRKGLGRTARLSKPCLLAALPASRVMSPPRARARNAEGQRARERQRSDEEDGAAASGGGEDGGPTPTTMVRPRAPARAS